ncbi:serine/threonine-protein kinase H1 homolog isoform X1 [Ixodes scapularis]|uniref:serine/threonine-protein kinase H1 homolog isoform X2 n=1 Tax=Ixodes scapularis TaxID=6945 RepID=UPI001C395C03|nr:serine/threonine-protein kinase H1 homolog isoform X2 [Ixodes scapularis]XP_040065363.2 serine/threonine-protein kinase H1 homolog isoform X1 [Ixodes scapularis]
MGCNLFKEAKVVEEADIFSTASRIEHVFGGPCRKEKRKSSRQRNAARNGRRRNSKSSPEHASLSVDARVTAKYVVKAVIAKGRFSRVVRVEHRTSRQPYAIKIMEARNKSDVFEAELSVLRRVLHPNVVRLDEVFQVGQRVYMVMELATGGNLLDRMEIRGPFRESEVAEVLRMVLSGLDHIHSLGITHRDLRPENLLYAHPGPDAKLMIADFGVASTPQSGRNVYMHTVCGTLQYMAPEVVARRPYTRAVDMWAVGVIAFLLFVEAFPFDAQQDVALLKLILKARVSMSQKAWSDVSRDAKDLVRQLLQRDACSRPTAAQALGHPWLARRGTPSPQSGYLLARLGCNDSGGSASTDNSRRSTASSMRSGRSVRSLLASPRRVHPTQLEALHQDPEVVGFLASPSAEQPRAPPTTPRAPGPRNSAKTTERPGPTLERTTEMQGPKTQQTTVQ